MSFVTRTLSVGVIEMHTHLGMFVINVQYHCVMYFML